MLHTGWYNLQVVEIAWTDDSTVTILFLFSCAMDGLHLTVVIYTRACMSEEIIWVQANL